MALEPEERAKVQRSINILLDYGSSWNWLLQKLHKTEPYEQQSKATDLFKIGINSQQIAVPVCELKRPPIICAICHSAGTVLSAPSFGCYSDTLQYKTSRLRASRKAHGWMEILHPFLNYISPSK
jgi:hypothetical protein